MAYLIWWVFQAIVVYALVLYARSKRARCGWTKDIAHRRRNWGIVTVAVVQIATFLRNVTEGRGIGPFYHIQWIGVYWIALSWVRLDDLKKEAAGEANQSVRPGSA